MPRTTACYSFEFTIWDWMRKSSPPCAGEHPTLLAYVSGEQIDSLHAWRRGAFPASDGERLLDETRSWLFYDPFDAPEYAWLSWNGIDRPAMEALIGSPLALTPQGWSGNQARELEHPVTAFPAKWGVMF